MTDVESRRPRSAEFGNVDVKMMPLDVITDLRQMRELVDSEALELLKSRIITE